ncbi:MAG TPA: hypothetical protein VMS32_02275 [Verrucomicrobiae bacterium]|jgi:hypothetical protein|nr:hypothetical protein [Verrucomicrobiae bacterium]
MIRKRIAALVLSLAFLGTLAATSAASNDEYFKVINRTNTPVWVTFYVDVGAFGWRSTEARMVGGGSYYERKRNSIEKDGPYRFKLEVTSPNGRFYNKETVFWYGGAQHNYNAPGDRNSYFYICANPAGDFFWSIAPNCSRNDNQPNAT